MTLSEIALPVSYEWGCGHALLFGPSLAQRLAEVQAQYGDPENVPSPLALTDGRFMLTADILTECVGGFLAAAFSHLDASRFDEIEVVPIADALALLPPPVRPE
jgi:hypothetical protein